MGGINTYSYVGSNPLSFVDPTGEVIPLLLIPVISAAVGATAGGVGNYLVQKYIQENCEIDIASIINASVWGGIGGFALASPGGALAGVGGGALRTLGSSATSVIGIGAAANVGQYFTGQVISGNPITGFGVASSAFIGALGGWLGGNVKFPVTYGAIGTALPQQAQNAGIALTINQSVTASTLTRNVGGGVIGNFDPFAPRRQGCSCQ